MKKMIAAWLALILTFSFTACAKSGNSASTDSYGTIAAKTGYSVISTISDITETTLTINSVCAGVLVDRDGKIIDCKIDQMQIKPDLDRDKGNVADLRTKREKKEDYSLKSASSIQKEWYEQISAFEKFAKGKTADEIISCVAENGYASDADLKAGCTINVSDISLAVSNAVKNARELGASSSDTLKLAISSEKFDESNDKNLQYNSDYAVITLGADGRITSCLIDASQAKCSVENGKFTVSEGNFASKKELKKDYAMKGASEIGKEWYQQAAAFEEYAKGKTADELTNAVAEDGYSSDADLRAGCTISLDTIVSNILKAVTA